ncbi:hypothetical protein J6590_062726 [Homalodisca vitripennis]|nr:hypothetical protein J6590_062726 [Homalodisca vitripennis]
MERRIQWMGHVKRMGDNRMLRIALEKEERGRRPRGRWEDQVWKDIERKGLQKMQVETKGGCARRPVITETSDDDDDDDFQYSQVGNLVTCIGAKSPHIDHLN